MAACGVAENAMWNDRWTDGGCEYDSQRSSTLHYTSYIHNSLLSRVVDSTFVLSCDIFPVAH